MKKIIMALIISFYSSAAFSTTPCPPYADSCTDYNGNTGVYNLQPVNATVGASSFVTIATAELTAKGVSECINDGTRDDACIGMVLINTVKSLKAQIDSLSGNRAFNYPSRTINSCFQISSTKDALFNYKVDITTGLSLTTGAQGTVTLTSYTNSGCTTGAQVIVDGTASQTGALVVGLGVNQTVSTSLTGMAPKNTWLKITTANTVGTPTFSIRAAQQEVLF